MKKTHIIAIVLAVIALAAGTIGFLWAADAIRDAEASHSAVYQLYQTMLQNATGTVLTVTEDDIIIGTYTLEQLDILAGTQARIDSCFSDLDRMTPSAFEQLSVKEKLQWQPAYTQEASVDLTELNLELPMHDLLVMPRATPEDAYVEFTDGSFLVHDEISGTVLLAQNVQSAMAASLEGLTVTPSQSPAARFEVTSCDCYIQPEKTRENSLFDFDAMLRDKLQSMTVELDFHGTLVTLAQQELSELLYTDQKGRVQVEEDRLAQLVNLWHETYQEKDTPYLFAAQIGGVKPIEFLKVDYEIDQAALTKQLLDRLVELESMTLEVPWLCWRNGEAFSIADTYVEIDIPNQVMTYIQDGEVLVTTDVVTGASWGYPTPPGLYKVENKDTNCWLSGEDYNVHVDYWIGFIGYQIGIHDADWRTKFGGENYVKNGSHGCVNTPKAAVQVIFDNIEVGTPVLVYGK